MNRYQNIPITKVEGKRIRNTVRYPEIPLNEDDWYVISSKWDRYDILAQQFYGDSSLWWIISSANETLKQNSLVIPEGIQIRIPTNPSNIINEYVNINT